MKRTIRSVRPVKLKTFIYRYSVETNAQIYYIFANGTLYFISSDCYFARPIYYIHFESGNFKEFSAFDFNIKYFMEYAFCILRYIQWKIFEIKF